MLKTSWTRRGYQYIAAVTAALLLGACNTDNADPATQQARATQYTQRAATYAGNGQFRAAVIEARNAIKQDPSSPNGHLALARIYNQLGQGKAADDELRAFSDSDNADIIFEYATALILQRKFRSADQYLNQHQPQDHLQNFQLLRGQIAAGQQDYAAAKTYFLSIEQAPLRQQAQLELAKLQLDSGDTDAATKTIAELLETTPEYTDAMVLMAKIAYQSGDLEKAETLLSDALIQIPETDILTPQKILVLRNLVSTLTQLGRTNEALIYSKLLANASPDAEALKNQLQEGVAQFKKGNLAEAKKLLLSVYEKSAADSAGILLGIIAYNEGDYATAETYLSKHVDPEVAATPAVRALAASQLRLNKTDELLENLDIKIDDAQKDPALAIFIGLAQIKSGNEAAGVAALNKAIDLAPKANGPRLTLSQYYLSKRQFEKALAVVDAGLKTNPNDIALHAQWIKIQLGAQQIPAALEHAETLVKAQSESADAQILLGQAAMAAGNANQAVSAMQRALALTPDNPAALKGLGQVALLSNNVALAQQSFTKLIAVETANPSGYKGLISVLELQAGDAARDTATIANKLLAETNTPTAHAVLAEYYLRRNQLQPAQQAVSKISSDHDQDDYIRDVRLNVALASTQQAIAAQQYRDARTAAMQGLAIAPQHPRLMAALIKAELADKQVTEAEKILQQLQATAPDFALNNELQGDIWQQRGKHDDAIDAYRQAWQQYQSNELGLKLVTLLQQQGQAVAAKALLADWQKQQPKNPAPYIRAAQIAHAEKQLPEAVQHYERALQLAPDNIVALNNLAWLYAESGDQRAVATAKRAYELNANNSSVADTYGWVLLKAGDKAQAITVLKAALAMDPDNKDIQAHLQQATQ